MKFQHETFRHDIIDAEKGPSLRNGSNVMQTRDVIQSTLGTTVKPEDIHSIKPSNKKVAAQKRLMDRAHQREVQEEKVLRGLKILKLEWDKLTDTERASRLNKLNYFGSCVVRENGSQILGLTDEEIREYVVKGRGLRKDEMFLDAKKYYRSEQGFKFWS